MTTEEEQSDFQQLRPAVDKLSRATLEEDREAFESALDEVTAFRERRLFQDVGKLARELHEALTATAADGRISEIARSEFPDARGRLDQVIAMTENSAHKTMDIAEQAIPEIDSMIELNRDLGERWTRFRERQLADQDVRALIRDVSKHFSAVDEKSTRLRGWLNEVLMAQDFQDLCGQEIRKVSVLVQNVELMLINMIRAPLPDSGNSGDSGDSGNSGDAAQPQSPSLASDDEQLGQDEADDILSSLGF